MLHAGRQVRLKSGRHDVPCRNTHHRSSAIPVPTAQRHKPSSHQGTTQRSSFRAAALAIQETEEHDAITEAADTSVGPSGNGVVAFADVVSTEPWTLVSSTPLEGGTLDIISWQGDRMIRVWLPPGYSHLEAGPVGYPTLYLNDGQNLFDDSLSFSGCSWRAAKTAAALISSGKVPPFVIVGIDHSGPTRSYDYLPYKPGSGPGGVRKDAASWPGGGLDEYFDALLSEVVPGVQERYGLTTCPKLMAFGGSSFGGINALYMGMRHPQVFDSLLVESPSLWFADEKCLLEDLPAHTGPWPPRTFIGMGTREYSGIRQDPNADFDARLVSYVDQVAEILKKKGVPEEGVVGVVGEKASHTERAWMERLPEALKFLMEPWWGALAEGLADRLYFTVPARLRAGQSGVVMFNRERSGVLGRVADVKLHMGYNSGWEVGAQVVDMEAVGKGSKWVMARLEVPPSAYELHFAFSDPSATFWDNNNDANFYSRVTMEDTTKGQTPEEMVASASIVAESPADAAATRNMSATFFTMPESLVAGAKARIYFNRACTALRHSPNVKVHLGFNQWQDDVATLDLKPTSLWRSEKVDWWASPLLQVPDKASEISFAFTDGHGEWESNSGNNFAKRVVDPHQPKSVPREVASVITTEHAGGSMDILTLTKRLIKEKEGKRSRWTEEKIIRVWTPPGFNVDDAPEGGWPVLLMNDGQNLFEDWLAHQGVSWQLGMIAARLIESGEIPPCVVVGIDSAGPLRSLNYLPYTPGTGKGGFRGDAERWPGGGVDAYMRRVTGEIMPMLTERYNLSTDPSRVAFGGGSFGGVCALYAALHYPHVFGSVLVESPSLWVAEGAFLRDLEAHSGALPERLFMGWGTLEYSATRDHNRPDVDYLLLDYYRQAHGILQSKGMRGPRMSVCEEEGAGHHELAWQWRLTGALRYLLGPWKSYW